MQPSIDNPGSAVPAHPAGGLVTPRSDFFAALAWIAFGFAVSIGAWRMDRLENQDVPPYAVPGLLPFFLGVAIMFFAGLMLARSWRRGALAVGAPRATRMTPAERKRFLLVLGLCLAFSVLLVGHGLPFWLAATVFVSATIIVLQYQQRRAVNQVWRGIVISIVIGLCAGFGVTFVFQKIFLVYLP